MNNNSSGGVAIPGAQAVDRALTVLFALADAGRPLSPAEIGRLTGLSKPTVHRLIKALAAWDLVRPDDSSGRYTLGFGVLRLSSALVKDSDIRSIARPFMHRLRDLSGETVALSLLINRRRVYIDQVESPHPIRWVVRIGEAAPLYAGAAAKALLAHLPEGEQAEILKSISFVRLAPNTPSSPEELIPQLAEIRRSGLAFAFSERDSGIAAVAAPFFDFTGRPVGALTICGPDHRFGWPEMERYREYLLSAVRAISAQLGYRLPEGEVVAG
ncbi:MAG: IclR family transcriptional regulator [Chloroflexota bacterium]